MQFSDSQWVPATPEQTWQALHDPAVLQRCIKGCDSVDKLSETEYAVTLSTRVAGAQRQFKGEILLADEAAPYHCQLAFEGTEEHAGLAIGHADVTLQAAPHGGTRLHYTLHAAAGGPLAQLGQGPLERLGHKLVDGFFTNFVDYMANHAAAYQSSMAVAGAGHTPAGRGHSPALSWLMVAGTVVLIALYYAYLK